jgi:hypothetical protein
LNALAAFTLFHVAISLVGIFAGLIVAAGLLTSKRRDGWTAIFLVFTVATSVTGFMFPFHGFKPSYVVGAISLLILLAAIFARYSRGMAGPWRWIYVVTAMIAFYLNVFVLIVQSFMKVPALRALAPTQTEPPFKLTQLIVLVTFIVLTVVASIRFRIEPARLDQLRSSSI